MVTTCFVCQNLLSDYAEGILPASRHEEIRKHLDQCAPCRGMHGDLLSTLDILHHFPKQPIDHELTLEIIEAAESGKRPWTRRFRSARMLFALAIPLLFFAGVVASFPDIFPWTSRFRQQRMDEQLVRYFPLLQGASALVDEQANWLDYREPVMRSLWEEGGFSPEEFEKTFSPKGMPPTSTDKSVSP
jgi:Putative zinc-finger